MSVAEFVAGVDRLLSRAHELYPSGTAARPLTGGDPAGTLPAPPAGASSLGVGASSAGAGYQRSQVDVGGLDTELERAASEGGAIAEQGRTGSGVILNQARSFARSAGPLSNSAAGAQLIVATMDRHLEAMQGQLDQTSTSYQGVASQLRQVTAGYQVVSGGVKDAPAEPLDWKPGDKRHMPYIAGPGQLGPPNYPGSPPWVDVYDRTQDPDTVPHTFIRSDEIPNYQSLAPGALGPSTKVDSHGNPDPYIELAPNSGVWVPQSDFPGAKIYPPGWRGDPPPYGWEEYAPGSGIFLWHQDLLPEPYHPGGGLLPPATSP